MQRKVLFSFLIVNVQFFKRIKLWRLSKKCSNKTPGGNTSNSLTGMLFQAHISTTTPHHSAPSPSKKIALNSNPKKQSDSNTKRNRNRMTQDVDCKKWVLKINFFCCYIVFILINRKRYYNSMFSSTASSSFKGVKCGMQKLDKIKQ